MSILTLIVAGLLLFFGQRLYWLFVGGVGFVVGMNLVAQWLTGQAEWLIILSAVQTQLLRRSPRPAIERT